MASRWPQRFFLAAVINRSTSVSVRYSRVRRAALGGRLGVTVRFTMSGMTRLEMRCRQVFGPPGLNDCSDNECSSHRFSRKNFLKLLSHFDSHAALLKLLAIIVQSLGHHQRSIIAAQQASVAPRCVCLMASKVGLFSRLECETSGMGSRLTTMSLLEPRVRLKRAPTTYFKDFGFKLRLLRLLLQRSVLRKKKVGNKHAVVQPRRTSGHHGRIAGLRITFCVDYRRRIERA